MSQRRSLAPINPIGATAVCFNDILPKPFTADLLVDAGILIAHFDQNDAWHDAVEDFFHKYVYGATHAPRFYITYDIINECLHRLVQNYEERTGLVASPKVRLSYAKPIIELIASDAIELVTLNDKEVMMAIDRWANSKYGAKDAFHVSCQLDWGLDLITVDHTLMEELENDPDFAGRKVYFPDLSMRKTYLC